MRNQFEVDFWRRLCSPFPANAYKSRSGSGGKQWMYIPPRVLANRLDDVLGPAYWDTELDATDRGAVVRLILHIPLYDDSGVLIGRKMVTRVGSGGFKDAGGGLDADGVIKGAESNGFRKACSNLGIGRDLYREGMPSYVADLFGGWASGMPQSQAVTPQPAQQQYNSQPSYPQQGHGQQQPQQNGQQSPQQGQQDGVRFDPPFGKPGKNVYAWSKGVGTYFQFDLLGVMVQAATARGFTKYTSDWSPEFINESIAIAIVAASRLAHYKGELDQWLPSQPAQQQPAPLVNTGVGSLPNGGVPYVDAVENNIQNAAPPVQPTGDPNNGIKQAIVAQIKALITSQTGRAATNQEMVASINELSASTLNGSGVRGEVLQSLRNCNDVRWLNNMKLAAEKQIAAAAQQKSMLQEPEDDGLPC